MHKINTYLTNNFNFSKSKIRLLFALKILIIIFAIYSASKLPIYPDEVAYKIFLERFFINGGFKQSLTPYCTSGFMIRPAAFLWPAAIAWSSLAFFGEGWASYRLLPLLLLLTVLIYLAFVNYKACGSIPWASILLVGISPWLYGLLILRPEIFLLALGLLIYILCLKINKTFNKYLLIFLPIIVIFIYSLILYIHPKALYFLPLILYGILLGALNIKGNFKSLIYSIFFCLIAVLLSISALNIHKEQYLTCPEVPSIQITMNSQALNLMKIFEDRGDFLKQVNKLFGPEITERTLSQFNFKKNYDIGYLPSKPFIENIDKIMNFSNKIVILLELLILILSVIFSFKVMPIKDWILIFLFTIGLLSSSFLSFSRNWYDISMFMGSILVSTALYYSHCYNFLIKYFNNTYKTIYMYLIIFCSIGTMYLISVNFNNSFDGGYTGPGIPLSIDKSTLKTSINEILDKYDLDIRDSIIVDDLTYEYLKKSKKVFPASYLGLLFDQPNLINNVLYTEKVKYGIVRCNTFTYLISSIPSLNWGLIEMTLDKSSLEKLCIFSTK
ncbi:hypothetical protein [Polynucleobacter sp. AP-Kolm-20A-A1]|uniref:hypothetical protein n=1 Tax=Polynucleobacter sp. AP-Kolm-20A-A1 TaxID=2081041 RepID=UPI001BFED238|nr:hypothetical protein [Polynucleobacter sp. AP-Kolm-20A-A1]QWE20931.1 hypothetical protein C2745_01690 [Polynucleobacter sp. AP-Kolm-20A-A1]